MSFPAENEYRTGFGVTEPLGYILFVAVVLVLATSILQKAGVTPATLTWAAFVTMTLAAILPGYFVYAPGYSAFSHLGQAVRPSVIGISMMTTMAPGALVIAFNVHGGAEHPWFGIVFASLPLALMLSCSMAARLLDGTGSLDFAQLLAKRFASPAIGAATAGLAFLPLFSLFCGQVAAFARAAELYLGVPPDLAAMLCLGFLVALCWQTGARGLVLGSASVVAAMVAVIAATYLRPDPDLMLSASSAEAALRQIVGLALPFLPPESGNLGPGLGFWPDLGLVLLAVAAGLAVLPIFPHLMASGTGSSGVVVRTGIASVVAFAAIAWMFATVILPDGGLLAALSHPDQWLPEGEIGIVDRIAALSALMATAVFAAIAAHGMAVMIAGLGKDNGRAYLPARRLAVARIAVLLIAAAGGWVVRYHESLIPVAAQFALPLAAASLFPTTLAAAAWRGWSTAAAWVGMASGGLAAGAYLGIAHHVANGGDIPVQLLISGHPSIGASLLGMASNAIAMLCVQALLRARRVARQGSG